MLNDSSKRFEQGLNKERFLLAVQDYIHLLTWDKPEVKASETIISDDITNIINKDNRRSIDINIDNVSALIDKDDNTISTQLIYFIENVLIKTGAEVIKKDDKNCVAKYPNE